MMGSKIYPGESVGSAGDTAQGQVTGPAAGTGDAHPWSESKHENTAILGSS